MQRARILLVEDNCLIRAGLVAILRELSNAHVAGTSSKEDALLRELTAYKPHVVIVNPARHDDNGFRVIESLKKQTPTVKIIAIDLIPPAAHIAELVRAGVSGFILRDASLDDCSATIRAVMNGADVLPPVLTRTLFSGIAQNPWSPITVDGREQLTPRECDVLELIAKGFSNKEIANELHIATYTVKSHVHSVLGKLALRSRVELATYAYKAQLSNALGRRLQAPAPGGT